MDIHMSFRSRHSPPEEKFDGLAGRCFFGTVIHSPHVWRESFPLFKFHVDFCFPVELSLPIEPETHTFTLTVEASAVLSSVFFNML